MKTIAKSLIAISIMMISLQVIAGNPTTVPGTVHYKVQIHLPKYVQLDTRNFSVAMTDGNNRMIAVLQRFRLGKNSYTFTESESVTGIRVALLVYDNGNAVESFLCSPDAQKGKFVTGADYLFNLYVTKLTPEKADY